MKTYVISYLFTDSEDEGNQTDMKNFNDLASCQKSYSDPKYMDVRIKEYNEQEEDEFEIDEEFEDEEIYEYNKSIEARLREATED